LKPVILLVDDEDTIRMFLEKTIRDEGYEALTAATGQEALDKTMSELPDLVMLDLKLPDMNGIDVLRKIKECNLSNYSIYLKKLNDDRYYLFSYCEYTGNDFEADMQKMAEDKSTQKWWEVCKPCQKPLKDNSEDEWWAGMEEVFHCD